MQKLTYEMIKNELPGTTYKSASEDEVRRAISAGYLAAKLELAYRICLKGAKESNSGEAQGILTDIVKNPQSKLHYQLIAKALSALRASQYEDAVKIF